MWLLPVFSLLRRRAGHAAAAAAFPPALGPEPLPTLRLRAGRVCPWSPVSAHRACCPAPLLPSPAPFRAQHHPTAGQTLSAAHGGEARVGEADSHAHGRLSLLIALGSSLPAVTLLGRLFLLPRSWIFPKQWGKKRKPTGVVDTLSEQNKKPKRLNCPCARARSALSWRRSGQHHPRTSRFPGHLLLQRCSRHQPQTFST